MKTQRHPLTLVTLHRDSTLLAELHQDSRLLAKSSKLHAQSRRESVYLRSLCPLRECKATVTLTTKPKKVPTSVLQLHTSACQSACRYLMEQTMRKAPRNVQKVPKAIFLLEHRSSCAQGWGGHHPKANDTIVKKCTFVHVSVAILLTA